MNLGNSIYLEGLKVSEIGMEKAGTCIVLEVTYFCGFVM